MLSNKKDKAKATRESRAASPSLAGSSHSAAQQKEADNSLNNSTAAGSSTKARPTVAQGTIIEQTRVIPQPSKDSALNDSCSSEQSLSAPAWAHLEISKIGYFDPEYPASSNARDPICTTNREYAYRDIFAFIESLRAVSSTTEPRKFRKILQFLPNSFRNSASTWYNDELTDHQRDLLLSEETEINMWNEALGARFGGNGRRLAQSSVPRRNVIVESGGGTGRRRKRYSEQAEHFEQRSGEELAKWQKRIGKKNP
ncbi:MAG: hypothetical protein Q9195_000823 [Heterodermia aff. obscurata]